VKSISVLLVDDHAMVREALAAVINAECDLQIVGQASNGREGCEKAVKLKPQVVLLDVSMPDFGGIEAAQRIRASVKDVGIIMLTAHEEDPYVERALEAKVDGYLSKKSAAATLPQAIRDVASGRRVYDPSVQRKLAQYEKENPPGQLRKKNSEKLTARETEVLKLVAEGNANKQTADKLGISIKTVEKHRQNVMEKLRVHDTAGLTRYAVQAGLVEAPVFPG